MAKTHSKSRSRKTRRGGHALLFAPVFLLLLVAGGWFGLDMLETSHAETPAGPKAESPVSGTASVIDADTLDIHGQRIRLVGVDAPESGQKCLDASAQFVRCGSIAANALDAWINRNPVTCTIEGADRYKRLLGQCSVRGESVQEWLVSNGHALAYRTYSNQYIAAEDQARRAKAGMWAGRFIEPWDWRKGERLDGEKATRVASR